MTKEQPMYEARIMYDDGEVLEIKMTGVLFYRTMTCIAFDTTERGETVSMEARLRPDKQGSDEMLLTVHSLKDMTVWGFANVKSGVSIDEIFNSVTTLIAEVGNFSGSKSDLRGLL